MSMATDPAVLSVEYDCYNHITSLTESVDSSPGHHLYDEVARRLSVQVDAPWGIDRIDTKAIRAKRQDVSPRVRLVGHARQRRAQPRHPLPHDFSQLGQCSLAQTATPPALHAPMLL